MSRTLFEMLVVFLLGGLFAGIGWMTAVEGFERVKRWRIRRDRRSRVLMRIGAAR